MDKDQSAPQIVAKRVAALDAYGILDTTPTPGFDDIVLLATRVCETPVALVSLVTENRQWFKARIGFPACETPLGQSVCAHALGHKDVFVIPDLTLDDRTRHNTLVTGEPFIRFYAGAVLHTADAVPLGTLCVIDTVPRPGGLTAMQADNLKALARQVMSQMELHKAIETQRAADAAFKQHQDLLKSELNHRLNNILTVVQAITYQTLRSTKSLDEAREALSNRIIALSRAQEILFAGSAETASLKAIVQSAAELHHDGLEKRFIIQGPEIDVGPKAALSLSLMMHELGTNATKYGALSTPGGGIVVDWSVDDAGTVPRVTLIWRERGGPPVKPPSRRGFGSRLIERALGSEVGATITLDYALTGLECRLSAPLSGLRASV